MSIFFISSLPIVVCGYGHRPRICRRSCVHRDRPRDGRREQEGRKLRCGDPKCGGGTCATAPCALPDDGASSGGEPERKSVGCGKSVSGSVDLGGSRNIKKK